MNTTEEKEKKVSWPTTNVSSADLRSSIGRLFEESLENGMSPSVFFESLFASWDPEFKFYSWQRDFFDALFDMDKKQKRIAVAAGNSLGKTYASCLYLVASMLVCDFLGPMKARITTPTGQSASTTVMETIRRTILGLGLDYHFPHVKAGMIHWGDDKQGLMAQIYVMAIPIDAERFDSIRGLHLPGGHLIMVYDECSRFPIGMWTENEGNMANPHGGYVTWLAISNPRESTGGFLRCFYEWKNIWTRFQVDMETLNEETGGAFEEHIRSARILYGGEDSPEYRCYIKSQFTLTNDYYLFNQAQLFKLEESEIDYVSDKAERPVIGVDISTGVGRAFSAICVRKSKSIPYWERRKLKLAELVEWIMNSYAVYGASKICIDTGGYGRAIYECVAAALDSTYGSGASLMLLEAVHAGGTPDNPYVFKNRRAECVAKLAEWIDGCPRVAFPPGVSRAMCQLRECVDSDKKDFQTKKSLGAEQEDLDMMDALLYSFPAAPKIIGQKKKRNLSIRKRPFPGR